MIIVRVPINASYVSLIACVTPFISRVQVHKLYKLLK